VGLGTPAKSTDVGADQACCDALATVNADPDIGGDAVRRPAFPAHQVAVRGGKGQPMPLTHFHEMDGAGMNQRLGQFVRALHQPKQMGLGFKGQTTAVTASLGPASPTHFTTSSKHGQQVFSDRINVTVAVHGMKNSEVTVPCRKRSGLFMVGAQPVVDR